MLHPGEFLCINAVLLNGFLLLHSAGAGVSLCSHMVFWERRLTQIKVDKWGLVAGKTETHG